MYTQCSKCETVFKLSAEVLRAAGGQVRCGKCGEVFNALARLAEESSAFPTGESPLDLEQRADSILASVVAPQVAHAVARDAEDLAPPGVEIAQLEILDWTEHDQAERRDAEARVSDARKPAGASETPDDQLMEFTLPPGELDRIFVESKSRLPLPSTPKPLVEADLKPEPEPEPETEPEPPPHPESVADRRRPARNGISGLEVPEDVRREMLKGIDQDLQPDLESDLAHEFVLLNSPHRSAQRGPFKLWLAAAVGASLLLIMQITHHSQGPFGGVMRTLYAALGAPLPQPANLSAYQLRQWGVTGDPEANGTLRLRASILNTAAQLQPYPLLRVTLADRFGKSIGTRDFEPSEYIGKPTARLLAPGERVDATLEILDPGKSAEGFEIDVCMRGAAQRISCANDTAAPVKR